MKLTQVKGSTWVIEANQLIPLYRLGEGRCVLLDTGLLEEREELEETLRGRGSPPRGAVLPRPCGPLRQQQLFSKEVRGQGGPHLS